MPLRLSSTGNAQRSFKVALRGIELLHHPMLNRGSAFTQEQREIFGLRGLLPPGVSTLAQQSRRMYESISRKSDPLEKYIGLASLQNRNQVLFFRLLLDHLEEFLPIVYTPTVGQACQQFSKHFRQIRGIWITPADRGRVYDVLANAPYDDIRLIVVTDNERILGLGDQGCGGMGIPVGKLALYTAAAGIHPTQTLPVSIDVGTDNAALRADDLYLGWPKPRLRGREYDELIDEFVSAVKKRFPKALLQWEDFKKQNAFDLLDRYRKVLPSFNDDIQGTAAVALAGVLASGRVTGRRIDQERVLILGAGAAGIGIARQLRDAMRRHGLEGEALTRAIALLDSGGLLIQGRDLKDRAKHESAWPEPLAASLGFTPAKAGDLLSLIEAFHPTVLLGTSGEPGAFSEAAIRAMSRHVERPVILPFSNPTSKSEAIPKDLIEWTDGRALIATGSPFPAVSYNGRSIQIGQGNNVLIFPGVGLGVLVSQAREVTDSMFTVAAEALVKCLGSAELDQGALYPRVSELRRISAAVAQAVVREVRDKGLGHPIPDDQISIAVADAMWTPEYPELEPV
jgi:malic enzyme